MSLATIKTNLHEAIENEQNEEVLQILESVLAQEENSSEPLTVSADQVKELQVSYNESLADKVIDIEKANQMIDEWLKK